MNPVQRAAFLAALFAFSLPAAAESAGAAWQGSIGAGARSVTHTEYGLDGRQLVREDGWLPGVSLRGDVRQGSLTWFGGADWYQGGIDYQGRTQGGVAAMSTTSTRLASARVGAAYALGSWSVLAALEIDGWRRDIHGTAAAAGLQETYRSGRLLLGGGKTWQLAAGAVSTEAAVVLAAPERMHIGFSGLFDPMSLDTRRGHGLRLGAGFRPGWAPSLELRARADWLKVPRSGAADLTRNGGFQGTVTQPEHVRRGITLELATVFE